QPPPTNASVLEHASGFSTPEVLGPFLNRAPTPAHRSRRSTINANSAFGIADIALFAYTHDAPAAGIALDEFPNVTQWLARVRAQPGFVAQ
ncbi:MAG: glutathione binding-like protein, partial [Silanimonas sp.]